MVKHLFGKEASMGPIPIPGSKIWQEKRKNRLLNFNARNVKE